jgi:anti-sigma regulatory factor (Ser/Thr protein kinase)
VGTAISLVRLMPLAIKAPVTILTQRATLRQQQAWLRDILDSVTDGRLKLCADRSDLPDPLGPEPATISITAPSGLRGLRKLVRDAASQAGFETSQDHGLLSSVHEAAMNALVHAGAATVRCYSAQNRVQVWIEDTGPGISLDKLPIATLKQGYSSIGTAGQGWHLILSFVDAAYLLTGPDGTTLVLEMDCAARRLVPVSAAVGGDVLPA